MNVLAIGGHADDLELGAGGSLAKHASAGDNVHVVLVTHSGYSSYDGTLVRRKEVALQEARHAGRILGIKSFTCLNYETKLVEFDVTLIEDLNREVDKRHVDLVYTHWTGDINQDHSAIAKATLVAARNIPRILMYRSNWYKSVENFDNNFYVDISDHLETKVASIRAHESELGKRGNSWIDFVKHQNRNSGIELGVEYAESFQLVKWLI